MFTHHHSRTTHHDLSRGPSINSELFRTLLQAKSNPCHSYEYMGRRGSEIQTLLDRRLRSWRSRGSEISYLVEIEDSAPGGVGGYMPRLHISLILHHLTFSPHRALNPYAPSHTRCRHPKSLCAFTYENTGVGGSASSHFLFSIFTPNPSFHPCAKLLPRTRREHREFPPRNRRADLPHQLEVEVKIVVRVQDRAQDFVGHE
jgi:hypothetical protein